MKMVSLPERPKPGIGEVPGLTRVPSHLRPAERKKLIAAMHRFKAACIEPGKATCYRRPIRVQAPRGIHLVPPQQSLRRVMERRKDISHIVKDGKSEPLPYIR